MVYDRVKIYEILRLGRSYGVAEKNLEIEGVFETRAAACAYIIYESLALAPEPFELADQVDRFLLRKKNARIARLVKKAIANHWGLVEKPIISNKVLFARELCSVNEDYLVEELLDLSDTERQALDAVGFIGAVTDWLIYIGRIKKRAEVESSGS